MSTSAPLHFLIIMAATHGLYAESFLRELKRQGHRVVVVTRAEALGYDWPREYIDALYAVKNIFDADELRNAVTYLAREERIDRLVGPGEYDIELAARLREHLRVPGMGDSRSRYFRDKLAMRDRAQSGGVPVPRFVAAIHRPTIAQFLNEVPGPWVLKPRTEASSKGIQVLRDHEQVWRALDALGDTAADHLIERFVPGDVFHVDGVVSRGQVLFAAPHRYGKPILRLHKEGGVYTTWRLQDESPEAKALLALNQEVVTALGLREGVTHIEYIRDEDGKFFFLEAGARVGAGLIEEMVEAHSGVNLWAEWARIEIAEAQGVPYQLPPVKHGYAGVLASAVHHQHPDPRPYLSEGVRFLPSKPYHIGLLVEAESADAVAARLQELAQRVGRELSARF
jgi:biotin carboxylase